MKDFARYVILSSVMPASTLARPIPTSPGGTPFGDAGGFDPNDNLGWDGKPLPSKALARGKRNPAS